MTDSKQVDSSEKTFSPAKLSFQIHSPLFRLDLLSPTFTISLSSAQGLVDDIKRSGLNVDYSASSMPDTPAFLAKAAGANTGGLSPLLMAEDLAMTSKSTEIHNRMIDEQLELLGELFPKQAKKLSQPAAVPTQDNIATELEDTGQKLSAGHSSDFHNSPGSDALALSSDWPKLPDMDNLASVSKRTSSASDTICHDESSQAMKSGERPPSIEQPLIQRRSLAPTLRVNTADSQQYATKELKLIRKMKEEGRMRAEGKVKPERQSDPVRHRREGSVQETLKVPSLSDNAGQPAALQLKEPDTGNIATSTEEIANNKDHPAKGRRNSADSAVSHIIWSAIVEKFSEMAHEIAGEDGNREEPSSRQESARTSTGSSVTTVTEVVSTLVGPRIEVENREAATLLPVSNDTPLDCSGTSAEEATIASTEETAATTTGGANAGPKTTSLEITTSPTVAMLAVPSVQNGTSVVTTSIMKKAPSAMLVEDADLSDTPSEKSNKYKVIKLKRGRTVRVQSHHASVRVEGDYADFLKKAIGGREKDLDASSLKSGKSNKSGAWSTKSGVENGCFRRGSMRSIKTGRTIATVGDVPIRDLSRGARFRHPNPFFSQQHGFRKIKAPHQAGPGVLRRKGSRIVRLSVFEGRSTQELPKEPSTKRLSEDAETLGSTLARIVDSRRKDSSLLIGELSFENDEPAKARTQTRPTPKQLSHSAPSLQAPLSSANLAAYAATAIGVSAQSSRQPTPAKLAYAASAYASGSLGKPASSASQATPGFPFPALPATLPPVPVVTMRGFPSHAPSASGVPPVPRAPGSILSASSVISSSRANILGAQMRGAQMLGASQSNISIASNRSGASPKRNKTKQGSAHQCPASFSPQKKPYQALSTKAINALPMSRVEDSFISMTPARSEMSIKSARSIDREQMPMHVSSQAQAYPRTMAPSLPTKPVLPEEMRASYRMRNEMRSSTVPLPPLPNDVMPSKPLPLRAPNGPETVAAQQAARPPSHRQATSLTVDTEAAREQAKKQWLAKQAADRQKQQATTSKASEENTPNASSRATEANVRDLDAMQMPFPQNNQSSGRNAAEDAPKTGNSFSGKMSAMFTPKRPARSKESATELPVRVPRPPSASPVDTTLNHFNDISANRQSTTSTSASSIQSKTKGIKIFGGFSKIKKGVGEYHR